MPADDRYRFAASIYDFATATWSGGAIWRSRADALRQVVSNERVLIPGPGSGRLAVAAARRGARVVALEPSAAMRRRLEARLARAPSDVRERVELRPRPLDTLATGEHFDVVVAEHFLNVFDAEQMPVVRERLLAATRPGGALVVADFAPAAGPWPVRCAQRVHHRIPLFGCALLTKNALHPIYDHGAECRGRDDIASIERRDFRSFRIGPAWWSTWTFRRAAEHGPAYSK